MGQRLWRLEALVAAVACAFLLLRSVVDAYRGHGFLSDLAYGLVAGGAAALCWRNGNAR
jgi:ABC-type nickel/cobalt efflux system permease component RcnA